MKCNATLILCGEDMTGQVVIYSRQEIVNSSDYKLEQIFGAGVPPNTFDAVKPRLILQAHERSVTTVDLNDRVFVTGSADGSVKLWGLELGEDQQVRVLPHSNNRNVLIINSYFSPGCHNSNGLQASPQGPSGPRPPLRDSGVLDLGLQHEHTPAAEENARARGFCLVHGHQRHWAPGQRLSRQERPHLVLEAQEIRFEIDRLIGNDFQYNNITKSGKIQPVISLFFSFQATQTKSAPSP